MLGRLFPVFCPCSVCRLSLLSGFPAKGGGGKSSLFVCEVCLKCFRSRQVLESHFARWHQPVGEAPQPRKYACTFCPYTTNIRTNVVTHERTHTGEKPYVCSVCQRAFTQMCSLLAHQAIHNRQQSYRCGECGLACASRSSLAQHRRWQHPSSSSKDRGRGRRGGGGGQLADEEEGPGAAEGGGGDDGQLQREEQQPDEQPSGRPCGRTTHSQHQSASGQQQGGETPHAPPQGAPAHPRDGATPGGAITIDPEDDEGVPDTSGWHQEQEGMPYPRLQTEEPFHFLEGMPYTLPPAQAAPSRPPQNGNDPLHFGALGGHPYWGVEEDPRFVGQRKREDARGQDQ